MKKVYAAKTDWLWDRNIQESRVKKILSNPADKRFFNLSALLLARKNIPKEVLGKYLDPVIFCRNWGRIKKEMRKNKWNNPRIDFWQAIYETVKSKLKKKGYVIRGASAFKPDALSGSVGKKLKEIRRRKKLSQNALAKKLSISQQMISRIEKGAENISLRTLANIAAKLNAVVDLNLRVKT